MAQGAGVDRSIFLFFPPPCSAPVQTVPPSKWWDSIKPYLHTWAMGDPSSYWFHADRSGPDNQSADSQGGTQRWWTGPHYNRLLSQCHWQRAQGRGTPEAHRLEIEGSNLWKLWSATEAQATPYAGFHNLFLILSLFGCMCFKGSEDFPHSIP